MSGGTTAGTPRRALPAALISMTTGLVLVTFAPPAALAASHRMSSISAGGQDSCGIESAHAYCWGDNATGELGDGSSTADSSVPVAVDTSGVLAGKTLTQISVGFQDACALDSAGAA
jgi:alpha-tubulin suppressor-like RCC1 family protein